MNATFNSVASAKKKKEKEIHATHDATILDVDLRTLSGQLPVTFRTLSYALYLDIFSLALLGVGKGGDDQLSVGIVPSVGSRNEPGVDGVDGDEEINAKSEAIDDDDDENVVIADP